MPAAIRRLIDWGAELRGSTRPVALIRIGVATLALVRYADEVALFQADSPLRVLLAVWFFAAILAMLVGYRTRVAVAAASLALAGMYFGGGFGARIAGWSHHHAYLLLMSTVLLNFTPCGQSYSVDRVLALRRAARAGLPPPPERGALWGQRLLALQLVAIYFWTVIDKSNWAFLSGERLEQTLVWIYSGRSLEALLLSPWFAMPAAIAVVMVEYFLPVGLLVRRLQPIAIPIGILLHLAFYVMLPVATYSASMVLLYLAVLDPDAVHRFIDRLQGHDDRRADPHPV